MCSHKLIVTLLMATHGCEAAHGHTTHLDTVTQRFELLGIKDGLSQGLVSSMALDTLGYLWITSKDGLNRYDGYGFKVFRRDPAVPTSIAGDHVSAVLVDRRGRMWTSTHDKQVDLFDPLSERFIHVEVDAPDLQTRGAIDHWMTFRLAEDPEGNVWVNLGNKGPHVIIDTRSAHELGMAGAEPLRVVPAHQYLSGVEWPVDLRMMLFDPLGNLWVLSDSDLVRYAIDLKERIAERTYSRDLAGGSHVILNDPRGRHLLLIGRTFMDVIDATSGTNHSTTAAPRGLTFNAFAYSDDGRRLVLSMQPRFQLILEDGERPPYLMKVHVLGEVGDLHADIMCHLRDREGNHWMGTSGYGVIRVTRNQQAFHTVKGMDGSAMSIHGLSEDLAGNVLFSKHEFEWLDPRDHRRHSSPIMSKLTKLGTVELGWSRVQSRNGLYWMSVYLNGRCRLYSWDPVSEALMDRGHYSGAPIWQYTPMFLGPDSSIWYGATINDRHTICRLNEANPAASQCTPFPVAYRDHGIQFISSHHVALDGSLWLGTCEGVFQFEPRTRRWRQFNHVDQDSTSLATDMVFSLCADPTDPGRYLWVGTNGRGMDRMDMSTGRCEHFGIADGLPNLVVYGILTDERQHVWVSTNQGLCLFDPKTRTARTFTERDGLQSNEFNRYASCRTRSGRMYFGGVVGVTHFDPLDFHRIGTHSPVILTEVRVMNRPLGIGAGERTTLAVAPAYTRTITLGPEDRMVTLRFACMDLTNPGSNRFRYKLTGFDNNWVEAGTNNEATFTNLFPGEYLLEVQGMNGQGMWSEAGMHLLITVLPPWWATWWFRGVVFLVALSGLYWLYRSRTRSLKLGREVAILETRSLRSQMNPHFIFNALNSINAFIQRNEVDKASSFLTRFARVMRGVLENSRSSEVPLEDDLRTLRDYMELERQRANERFDFTITVAPDIDAATTMVPPLVVQPFVENAIWHGMAGLDRKGHIRLSVKRSLGHIVYTIDDDGVGRQTPRPAIEMGGVEKKSSLGTAITQARLELLAKQYGGQAGFHYVDRPVGTCVVVVMPERTAA